MAPDISVYTANYGTVAFLRFKALREQFIRYHTARKDKSSSAEKNDWKYYDDLLFLLDLKNSKWDVTDPEPRKISVPASTSSYHPTRKPGANNRDSRILTESNGVEKSEVIVIVSSDEEADPQRNVIDNCDSDSNVQKKKLRSSKRLKTTRKSKATKKKSGKENAPKNLISINHDKNLPQAEKNENILAMIVDLMERVPQDSKLQCIMDMLKVVKHHAPKN